MLCVVIDTGDVAVNLDLTRNLDKIDGTLPSYWAVCGYDDGWVCTDPRSFTKGVSAAPGD